MCVTWSDEEDEQGEDEHECISNFVAFLANTREEHDKDEKVEDESQLFEDLQDADDELFSSWKRMVLKNKHLEETNNKTQEINTPKLEALPVLELKKKKKKDTQGMT